MGLQQREINYTVIVELTTGVLHQGEGMDSLLGY